MAAAFDAMSTRDVLLLIAVTMSVVGMGLGVFHIAHRRRTRRNDRT